MSNLASIVSNPASAPAPLCRSSSQESILGIDGKDKYVLVRASTLKVASVKDAKVFSDVKDKTLPTDLKSVYDSTTPPPGLELSVPRLLKSSAASAAGLSSRVSSLVRGKKGSVTKMTVPFSFSLQGSAAGLANGVVSLLPDANATEWNAISLLFDEYKVEGFRVNYDIGYSTPVLIPGANTLSSDYGHVLVYDPVDQTPLTSLRQGTEASHHTLTQPKWRPVGTVAAPGICGTFDGSHHLNVKADSVKALNWNPGGTLGFGPPGQWYSLASAGSNVPFGALKSYGTSWHAAAVTVVAGIIYVDLLFRVRH